MMSPEDPIRILFRLKHGKMSGIVRMLGKLPIDNVKLCSLACKQPGLGCMGGFEHGKPVGTAWRGVIGGGWIYGRVDASGHLSGDQIAYVYGDLSTTWLGKFVKGVMVRRFS